MQITMGASVSISSQLRRNQDKYQHKHKQKQKHGKGQARAALLVFMDDCGRTEEEEEVFCWKLVSKAIVDASEFPNHIVTDASALCPGLPIYSEAAPLYRLRQGEIYYAIPVHRLSTVFTSADMLSLLQRSRAAMANSPSFAFAGRQSQAQQSFAIIDHHRTLNWDLEMRFLKTAAKRNNNTQGRRRPPPKVQGITGRLRKGPSRLAPVPECDDYEAE